MIHALYIENVYKFIACNSLQGPLCIFGIEEMASQATIELLLTMKAELCAYAHTSRHDCWAVASIKAPSFESESKVPIDVVAVIDVSSSMAGAKIELVKQTLLFVIGQRKYSAARMQSILYMHTYTLSLCKNLLSCCIDPKYSRGICLNRVKYE